jgi:hypothetical protein
MRYKQPIKKEQTFISDKIKINSNIDIDYYKIIAIKDIKKNDELIIEYCKYNLFGMEVVNRDIQILKLYLENIDDPIIKELYPRTNNYIKTKLITRIHKIIKSYSYFNKFDKDMIKLSIAKYIFNAFEGYDYGPLTLPIIAKINHSCKPNVKFRFNRDTGSMHLFAIRDIKKDEEIFVSYLENKKIKSHKEYLQEHYGFICKCKC